MGTITADDLRNTTALWADYIITRQKMEIAATVFATDGKQVFAMPAMEFMQDDNTKDAFLAAARKAFADMSITACCFVAEGWSIMRSELDPNERPSEAEDRVEVLTMTTEYEDGSITHDTWEIKEGRESIEPIAGLDQARSRTRFTFLAHDDSTPSLEA